MQDTSHPSFLLSKSAFRGTILPKKTAVASDDVPRVQPAKGEVIIRFRLWCAARMKSYQNALASDHHARKYTFIRHCFLDSVLCVNAGIGAFKMVTLLW